MRRTIVLFSVGYARSGASSRQPPAASKTLRRRNKKFLLNHVSGNVGQEARQRNRQEHISAQRSPAATRFESYLEKDADNLLEPKNRKERRRLEAIQRRQEMERVAEERKVGAFDLVPGNVHADEGDHGRMNQKELLEIPEESELARSTLIRDDRISSKMREGTRVNSWSMVPVVEAEKRATAGLRRDFAGTAEYSENFVADVTLDHKRDTVQHSTSIYTDMPLYFDGLRVLHEFITEEEERQCLAEFTELLLAGDAATYIPKELRNCVNLFHFGDDSLDTKPLGTAKTAVMFPAKTCAPTTLSILRRAFALGLIPSMPNLLQVSEFHGPHSYYPIQRKAPSLGSYYGILNFVSKEVLHLRHESQPWAPKIMLLPRSLQVFERSVREEFRSGYSKRDDSDVVSYQQGSRHSADFRVEVLFATAEPELLPQLNTLMKITRHADAMNDAKGQRSK